MAEKNTVEPAYPPATIPTFFADGVMNFNNSAEIAKFYFYRFDPATNAVGPNIPQATVQAVMSLTAFVQTAAFFNAAVANLLATKTITPQIWEAAQATQRGADFHG